MATCNRCIVSSPEPEPALPSLAPLSWSTDLPSPGDISGGDKSAHDIGINDPDAIPIPHKTGAADIQFFFDKTGSKAVCKECRWVLYVVNSSVFWLQHNS